MEVIICGPLLPGLPALGTFLYLGLAAPGTKMYLGLAALGTKMYLGLQALLDINVPRAGSPWDLLVLRAVSPR